MDKGQKTKLLAYSCSVITILTAWTVLSAVIKAELILPSPVTVLNDIIKLLKTGKFWWAFMFTFFRVVISFGISIACGFICGYFCSESPFFRNFMELPLTVIKSTPVIAVILITLFWFTSDWVPVFAGVLMSFPVITDAVTAGFNNKDEKMYVMAQCYNFSRLDFFKYIKLPACRPYFIAGADTAFGLSWKVIAAAEVLCLPKKAVGSLMQTAQVHLETSRVVALTVMLVLVSFIIKNLFRLIFCRRNNGKK